MTTTTNRFLTALCCAAVLAATGCETTQAVFDNLSGNTPGKYARLMESSDSADYRRVGINGLAAREFARKEPYTTRYRQIALNDPDPLVRATAVRALNLADDATATDVYTKALSDPSEFVRLEGAKALVQMPDENAVPALLQVASRPDENKDVRIAATSALQHYPRIDVGRALVTALADRDFGLAWHARRSLRRLTGQDFAYDDAAWLTYLTGPDKPLG